MRSVGSLRVFALPISNDRTGAVAVSRKGRQPPVGGFAGCGLSGQLESVSCAHQLAPDDLDL